MFDIDESEFEDDIPSEEESNSGFDNFFENNSGNAQNTQPLKRQKTKDKIFINGTKRGKQTQDMFNLINGIVNFTGKAVSNASKRINANARR